MMARSRISFGFSCSQGGQQSPEIERSVIPRFALLMAGWRTIIKPSCFLAEPAAGKRLSASQRNRRMGYSYCVQKLVRSLSRFGSGLTLARSEVSVGEPATVHIQRLAGDEPGLFAQQERDRVGYFARLD